MGRARQLGSQLHLTVMIAFMPDHVLEQKDRVVIVKQQSCCSSIRLFTASFTTRALSVSISAMRPRSHSGTPLFIGQSFSELGASSEMKISRRSEYG